MDEARSSDTTLHLVKRCASTFVLAVAVASMTLPGCGGSGSGSSGGAPPPPMLDLPESQAAAARFLMQATFGPSQEDIEHLSQVGYTAWLDEQRDEPTSLQRPALEDQAQSGGSVSQHERIELWWQHAVQGPDQLRQRMAYALSQIFVISDVAGPLNNDAIGMGEYYDLLARNSFGNFRTLLEDVTKSPQMGKYLNVLKNQKADPQLNIHPDENYAREVMQLFTIGLYKLAPDGTRLVDSNGNFIPTYNQRVVEAYAAVYTGWNYAGATNWENPAENYLPMTNWLAYHDQGAKVILDGQILPAGRSGQEDLSDALDSLFHHANVGPFIGRLLIERLVTSNPSQAYVQRVASAFANNGQGTRGDLFAVTKAILLDPEARQGHVADPQHAGKLREPLLRLTAMWRAFQATSPSGRYQVWNPEFMFGQAPLRSPSVFNFYSPDYQPPGNLAAAGLYAPEFQITTHTFITVGTNEFYERIFHGYQGYPNAVADSVLMDISRERALADDVPALVERLNLLLMAGQMSSEMRTIVTSLIQDTELGDGTERVLEGLYIIATSPECALQR